MKPPKLLVPTADVAIESLHIYTPIDIERVKLNVINIAVMSFSDRALHLNELLASDLYFQDLLLPMDNCVNK